MEPICLNCSSETTGKFCTNCGQKTDTHRITFGHFIAHDLLHGTFHLERGMLFTIKEAFRRPGKAALDYIGGKRIRYYNVFYLSLILIGLAVLISRTGENLPMEGGNAESKSFIESFSSNIKIILLGFVPLLALNGSLLFRKLKLNLAEHFIVSGFSFVGLLLIVNLFLTVDALIEITKSMYFLDYLLNFFVLCAVLFPAWAYCTIIRKHYSILGIFWRIIVFYLMLIIETMALMLLALNLFTGTSELIIN